LAYISDVKQLTRNFTTTEQYFPAPVSSPSICSWNKSARFVECIGSSTSYA